MLALWGESYLRNVFHLLEAPGVPVRLEYAANGGVMVITARSYDLNLRRGVLELSHLELTGATGELIASAETFLATGLKPLQLGNQVIRVRAWGVQGVVTRVAGGGINVEGILPKSSGPPSRVPYDVVVENARVLVVDKMGASTWRQELESPVIRVAGVGTDWMATAQVKAPGIGQSPLRLENTTGAGLKIDVQARQASIAGPLGHFLTTPEFISEPWAGFRARKVTVSGLLSVFIPKLPTDSKPGTAFRGPRIFVDSGGKPLDVQVVSARFRDILIDSGRYDGIATGVGASGTATGRIGRNALKFDGNFDWQRGIRLAGLTQVDIPSSASVPAWLARRFSRGVTFHDGHFKGWLAATGPSDLRADGEIRAATATYNSNRASGILAHLWLDPKSVSINVRRLTFDGEPVSFCVAVDRSTGRIRGETRVAKLDFARLAERFGIRDLVGTTSLNVTVEGEMSNLRAQIDAEGAVRSTRPGYELGGNFELDGSYSANTFTLQRALLQGPFGLATATGTLKPSGPIQLSVKARDLDPTVFDKRSRGHVNVEAIVDGSLKHPQAHGYAEGYAIGFGDQIVPAVSSPFQADLDHLELSELNATKGTARLAGSASLRFRDQAIHGTATVKALQVADVVGDRAFGSVDIDDATLGGTLRNPVFSANVEGDSVFAEGIELDHLAARVTSDGSIVSIQNGSANVTASAESTELRPPGKLKLTAKYDLDRREGDARVTGSGISLAEIMPKVSTKVAVDGTAEGGALLTFDAGGLRSVQADGVFNRASLNGTTLGSGWWTGKLADGKLTGRMSMLSAEGSILVDHLQYDTTNDDLAGHVELSNSNLKDLITIGESYFPDQTQPYESELAQLAGRVKLSAAFGVKKGLLSLSVPSIVGTGLSYQDLALGKLDSSIELSDSKLDIRRFAVTGGRLDMTASGTFDLNGDTEFSGRIRQVKIADIGQIIPALAGQSGQATISFDATGSSKSPDIQAFVEGSDLLLKTGQNSDHALRTSLILDADATNHAISVTGDYYFRGFQGVVDGVVPFDFPATIPQDGAVRGSLTVARRSLKEIASLFGGVDPAATEGTLSGKITASGTAAHPLFSGGLNLDATRMGFLVPAAPPADEPDDAAVTPTPVTLPNAGEKSARQRKQTPKPSSPTKSPVPTKPSTPTKIDATLRNVVAKLGLVDNKFAFSMSADSTSGGHATADVSTTSEEGLLKSIEDGSFAEFLGSGVTGQLKLDKFEARQSFSGGKNISAKADAAIAIAGSVSRPTVSGTIKLSNVDSNVPTFHPTLDSDARPKIDPSFNLNIQLATPAHLRTSAADLWVNGGGSIGGFLSAPSVHGIFQLDKGTIRLPGSTLRLDPGGTMTPAYDFGPGGAAASVAVDMVGRTALTALRYGDIYQRYNITVSIEGDLLSDGGLNLNATSEPGDLSQARILALVGETDLFETTNPGTNSDTDRRLRDALAGWALPALAEPLTSRVAQEFGLEYLTVEYNSYEQASVGFAKSLGVGFSLQGRRQVGAPSPGMRALYDFRLVYTPRRTRSLLSQLGFSFGADQDVPWKFDVEYGFKY